MKRLDKIKDSFRKFDDFQKQGLIDLACDYGNDTKEHLLNCNECGGKLGLWRMIYHAMGVKRGQHYFISCKKCGHINKIKRSVKNE